MNHTEDNRKISLRVDQKKFLGELEQMARQRGGRCLSDEYVNSSPSHKLRFQCKEGHFFESCRDYIKAGNWCPRCAGRGKTIADLQQWASKAGGRCLSEQYLGMNTQHRWECAQGHQWNATPNNVKFGKWCRDCGRIQSAKRRRKHTLDEMQNWARSKGGVCLSAEFESVIKPLKWQCAAGHKWEARPHNIKNGNWCPVCAQKTRGEKRKTHTLEEMQAFARSKGGRCLSDRFVQVKAPLRWECAQGHRWTAHADNIINGGKWCPVCSGNQLKTLAAMQQLALTRGGKCLSTHYAGANQKLWWECQAGHRWQTIPAVITRGGWCPECSAGLGERICRAYFEQLLGQPFAKARPPWLRTVDGHPLELDGYSEELQLAFEHQGSQHYRTILHFDAARIDAAQSRLEKTQAHDQRKRELCRQHGVTLIEVPSVLETLGVDHLKDFLADALTQANYPLPAHFQAQAIDLDAVYRPDPLAALKALALDRGGVLLSDRYLGIFEPLEWQCAQGHPFRAAPNNVKNSGSWCPKCRGRGKSIDDMRVVAAARGGTCESSAYVNNATPLEWACQDGHHWFARPSNVLFGTWCPACARKNRWVSRRNAVQPTAMIAPTTASAETARNEATTMGP